MKPVIKAFRDDASFHSAKGMYTTIKKISKSITTHAN